ncbi:MAG: hypothetical protein QOJ44_1641 [Acidimicrobiaceae bacterium]|nr:hypothetical protein [Acidimicrobiaceae bacterium]
MVAGALAEAGGGKAACFGEAPFDVIPTVTAITATTTSAAPTIHRRRFVRFCRARRAIRVFGSAGNGGPVTLPSAEPI